MTTFHSLFDYQRLLSLSSNSLRCLRVCLPINMWGGLPHSSTINRQSPLLRHRLLPFRHRNPVSVFVITHLQNLSVGLKRPNLFRHRYPLSPRPNVRSCPMRWHPQPSMLRITRHDIHSLVIRVWKLTQTHQALAAEVSVGTVGAMVEFAREIQHLGAFLSVWGATIASPCPRAEIPWLYLRDVRFIQWHHTAVEGRKQKMAGGKVRVRGLRLGVVSPGTRSQQRLDVGFCSLDSTGLLGRVRELVDTIADDFFRQLADLAEKLVARDPFDVGHVIDVKYEGVGDEVGMTEQRKGHSCSLEGLILAERLQEQRVSAEVVVQDVVGEDLQRPLHTRCEGFPGGLLGAVNSVHGSQKPRGIVIIRIVCFGQLLEGADKSEGGEAAHPLFLHRPLRTWPRVNSTIYFHLPPSILLQISSTFRYSLLRSMEQQYTEHNMRNACEEYARTG